MTQEEILEYNKRCAQFLGITYNEGRLESSIQSVEFMLIQTNTFFTFIESFETIIPEEHYLFHSDWNWIMEVVNKIYSLDIYYDKYKPFNSSQFTNGEIELSTNKEAVVQAINQFLIWYNENKNA